MIGRVSNANGKGNSAKHGGKEVVLFLLFSPVLIQNYEKSLSYFKKLLMSSFLILFCLVE